jgi:hypothetical protein
LTDAHRPPLGIQTDGRLLAMASIFQIRPPQTTRLQEMIIKQEEDLELWL